MTSHFQISKTVTAFLGGSNDPNAIVTYNWTTSNYTKHAARLNGARVNHACAAMKDELGQVVVITTSNCLLPNYEKLQTVYELITNNLNLLITNQ